MNSALHFLTCTVLNWMPSFTSRNLIDLLMQCRAEHLLRQLAFFRKIPNRDYPLWEEGSHPQLSGNEAVDPWRGAWERGGTTERNKA